MKYNGHLDSLRALAAIAVIGVHYDGLFAPGWIGVQLFFVLSGMLISDIVIRAKDSGEAMTHFVPRFFARRCFRLVPVYLFYLLILAAVFWFTGFPTAFAQVAPGLFTYTQNLHKLFPSYQQSPIYWHLWSLCAEWQFYLAWPFALWVVPAARRGRFLVGLVLLGPVIRFVTYWVLIRLPWLATHHDIMAAADAVYILPTSHVDAFAFGALLCNRDFTRWAGRWPVVACVAASAALLGLVATIASSGIYETKSLGWPPVMPASYQWVWGYSVLNFLSASVIALVLHVPPVLTRLPWLQYVGRISYGVYIFHMAAVIVVMAAAAKLPHFFGKDALGLIAASGVAIMAAAFSFRFIELPFQRLSSRAFPASYRPK